MTAIRYATTPPIGKTRWTIIRTAADAARAEVEYELAPGFKGRARVSDILARQVVAEAGPGGMALSLMRFDSVRRQPKACGGKEVSFAFDYVPGEPDVRTGAAAVIGRLCVIGSKLNVDALSELFGAPLKLSDDD